MTASTMPRLTTHVLDTASGKPAAGMRVELRSLDAPVAAFAGAAGRDGHVEVGPAYTGTLPRGRYEVRFEVGAFYRAAGVAMRRGPLVR